jgi:hypothetical protein
MRDVGAFCGEIYLRSISATFDGVERLPRSERRRPLLALRPQNPSRNGGCDAYGKPASSGIRPSALAKASPARLLKLSEEVPIIQIEIMKVVRIW